MNARRLLGAFAGYMILLAGVLVVGGIGDQLLWRGVDLEGAPALIMTPLFFLVFSALFVAGGFVSAVVARRADAYQLIAFSIIPVACAACGAVEAGTLHGFFSFLAVLFVGSSLGVWLGKLWLRSASHRLPPAA
jgi:hypothetical protein